ncbi:MAG: hypothetical protein ACLQGT_08230, partial [Terracidiphilus sp.]
MSIAPDLRPGLTQPHTNRSPQKLIKEKVPTHTPVWYQTIAMQVIYFHQDKSINHNKFHQTQQAELHRSRCNAGHPPGPYPP